MRQLSTCFDSLLPPEAHGTYYPSLLSRKIDEWTPRMQAELNTGVYKVRRRQLGHSGVKEPPWP